ncbi:MAG: hypothetical protein AAGH15_23725, partial [Myxococcota bacterium]
MSKPEPVLAVVLRALAHACAAAAFAVPLAHGEAISAAFFGAFFGAAAGPRLARSPVRTLALAGLGAAGVLLALGLSDALRGSTAVAGALGPGGALVTADALAFGLGAFALSLGLRATSARRRAFLAVEATLATLAFTQVVVAHRQGAINRPFALADPILAAGGDPTELFLFVGAAVLGVLGLLLLAERHPLRVALHLGVLLAGALLVLLFTRGPGMPDPPEGGFGLGLRGDEGDEAEASEGGRPDEREGDAPREVGDQLLDFEDAPNMDGQRVPVAVVLFHDEISSPVGVYYLRQDAHSQYNGRKLVGATRATRDGDVARGFPAGRMELADPPPVGEGRRLVETTVALLAEHTKPFGLEAPTVFSAAR